MMATTCASCGVVALLATVSAVPATVTVPVTVVVDTAANPTPFEHFWKKTFGSGHARLTLREDWQLHLKQARDELVLDVLVGAQAGQMGDGALWRARVGAWTRARGGAAVGVARTCSS